MGAGHILGAGQTSLQLRIDFPSKRRERNVLEREDQPPSVHSRLFTVLLQRGSHTMAVKRTAGRWFLIGSL
jgi:hypothetical protein